MYIRKPDIARPIRRHPLVCRTLLRRAVREPKEGVLRLRAPALVPEVGVSRLSQEASGYRHLSRLFPTTPNTSYPSTVKRGDRSRSFSTSASRWLPEWSAPFLEDRPVHLSKTSSAVPACGGTPVEEFSAGSVLLGCISSYLLWCDRAVCGRRRSTES